jgi:hypothetical protein
VQYTYTKVSQLSLFPVFLITSYSYIMYNVSEHRHMQYYYPDFFVTVCMCAANAIFLLQSESEPVRRFEGWKPVPRTTTPESVLDVH